MHSRFRRLARLGIASIATASLGCLLWASAGEASRPANHAEQGRVAAEVRLTLRVLADSPDSGIGHDMRILLAPVCISTADPRYAAAVANPVDAHGRATGQPGDVYLHRVPGGYRVVDGLRIGDQLTVRPSGVPRPAWRDLSRSCQYLGAKAVVSLAVSHQAFEFTT
jgi:hypothetical protein